MVNVEKIAQGTQIIALALTWDMLDALRLTVTNGMSIALCC